MASKKVLSDFENFNKAQAGKKYTNAPTWESDFRNLTRKVKNYENSKNASNTTVDKETKVNNIISSNPDMEVDLDSLRGKYNDLVTRKSNITTASNPDMITQGGSFLSQSQYNNSINELTDAISKANREINRVEKSQKKTNMEVDAIGSDDYDYYAKIGSSIENPSSRKANGIATFNDPWGLFNNDGGVHLFGKDVNNIVTYSRDNYDEIRLEGYGAVGDEKYHFMTDDEVGVYNYYLAKENEGLVDEGTAQSYLDSINETLNARVAADRYESQDFEGNLAKELAYGLVEAGPEQWRTGKIGFIKSLTSDDSNMDTTSTQYLSQMIRDDLADDGPNILGNSLGQVAYDFNTTTANMLPSIMLSKWAGNVGQASGISNELNKIISKGLGAVDMGTSAAGNSYQDMLRQGYSTDQAKTYAYINGALEAGLEYAIGGVADLGGRLTGHQIQKLTKMVNNTALKIAIEYGGEALSEAVEEGLQEALDPFVKAYATGEYAEISDDYVQDILYSALLGAISSVPFNTASNVGLNSNIKSDYGSKQQEYVAEGLEADKGTNSRIQAERNQKKLDKGKNLNARELRYQMEANEDAVIGKDKSTIAEATEERLTELGETGNVKDLARIIAESVVGEEISRKDQKTLDSGKYTKRVLNELNPENIARGNYTTDWAENINTKAINKTAYNLKNIISDSVANKKYKVSEEEIKDKISSSGKTQVVSEDGQTATDTEIKSIKSLSNGKMTFELTDGTVVDSSKILYANKENAYLYESVLSTDYSVSSANAIVQGYNSADDVTVSQYLLGINEAYNYGKSGVSLNSVHNDGFINNLTDTQKQFAYDLGRYDAGLQTSESNARVNNAKTKNPLYKKGKVIISQSVKATTPRQKASLSAIGRVVANVTHNNVVIYESVVNEKGKRVFATNVGGYLAGKAAPHGFYDPNTGTIYIDINSGNKGEGTMLWTFAHELTHYIREWSPTKFKVLADFLFEEYGNKGVNTKDLIQAQIDKAAANGRTISEDTAYEEVVADSMSNMFTDTNALDKIERLKKRSMELVEKIKSIISDILAKIKGEYNKLDPQTPEAKYVKSMTESLERLSDLFAEALVDAGENFDQVMVDKYLATKDILFNDRYVDDHLKALNKKFDVDSAAIELSELVERYKAVVDIWREIGGELNSKFLNEWNNQLGKDRAFTVFKEQQGYKYNIELASMCKKGIPLFEAIDTIVKKEISKKLESKVMGKAEKEILYDILKSHNFEIPCAICYVEQARQREGAVIDAFLNGKVEKNSKGKVTKFKLGWNQVLDMVEKEMAKNGVDYSFENVSRDIATDNYEPKTIEMDATTQKAYYDALLKLCNEEIERYNEENPDKAKKKIKSTKPKDVAAVLKGNLGSNFKIFKTLFENPDSRFRIDDDLLYSSATTMNLAMAHNDLYTVVNSQGGVSGYKTKQKYVAYRGDILTRGWSSEQTKVEGGIRNQSNSDLMMYTLLDQVQMYVDLSAKGYYLHAYTKVIAELKLLGLSNAKINASLIPLVFEYQDNGSTNRVITSKFAGLAYVDEKGRINSKLTMKYMRENNLDMLSPIYDDVEGVNSKEAFMLLADPEYSKSISGICIGYSDYHIMKLLDEPKVQEIIGFHDKTDDPDKRFKGAKFSKNYNGLNEATKKKADGSLETVHIGFNQFVIKAENMFKKDKNGDYIGSKIYNGKSYTANDIPMLAADLYKEYCAEKKMTPAYHIEVTYPDGSKMFMSDHPNYYKLLGDFGLKNSEGKYAPHKKVEFNMPDTVPYLDANGNKKYMESKQYIKQELEKELKVRDSISEALSDESPEGIIPQFVERVNKLHENQNDYLLSGRENLIDINGKLYSKVVVLDSKDFRKATRTAKSFEEFIYEKLINKKITVYDSEGNPEVIEFARKNERVKKDGAANPHPVLGEFTQERDLLNKRVIVNLPEVIINSSQTGFNSQNVHQWLDKNGFEIRTCYVMKENGDIIYPVKLSIGKTEDGRNLMYHAKVQKNEGVAIDINATSEFAKKQSEMAVELATPSDVDSVPPSAEAVNGSYEEESSDSKYLDDNIEKEYWEVASMIAELYDSYDPYDYMDQMTGHEDVTIAEQLKNGDYSIIDRVEEEYEEYTDDEKRIADDIIRRANALKNREDHTKHSDRDSLSDKQKVNYDYNLEQTKVGSPLRTMAYTKKSGGNIERMGGTVGKNLGSSKTPWVYFHRQYLQDAIKTANINVNDYSKAFDIMKGIKPELAKRFNHITYNANNNSITFGYSSDFDTAREPVAGEQLQVFIDDGHTIYKANNKQIFHHKWLWVENDYKGFNVKDSWEWSRQWLNAIRPTTEIGGGFAPKGVADGTNIEAWNRQLEYFELPLDSRDGVKYSDRQEYDSKDTSKKIVPKTFTTFGFDSNDRVLDWGGGQYDITKKCVESAYPGIVFEVVDEFNRTPEHNDRILSDFEKNKADVITINNVLNVIKEEDVIVKDVLKKAKKYLTDDGICYIKIWKKDATGIGTETPDGWQRNEVASDYEPLVKQVFKNVIVYDSEMLVASDKAINKKSLPKATADSKKVISDTKKAITKSEPTMRESLFSDRVLMGTVFSGGGTMEKGLIYQMVDKEFAVEYDGKIAELYGINNGKEHLYVGDVRDFDSTKKQNVFYLHASPSCKAFSKANNRGGESEVDITTAEATARILGEQMPTVFTMENVPEYLGSKAYNIIAKKLDDLDYNWDVNTYNSSDYGNATSRNRLIIRAVKNSLSLPDKPNVVSKKTSWGEATKDIWKTELEPSNIVPSMMRAIRNTPGLKNVSLTKSKKPIIIMSTNSGGTVSWAYSDEVAPTVTTKCGDARVIMNGKVYRPTPEFIARLQGFTNYQFEGKRNLTTRYTVMGNGIPAQLTKAVMGGVLDSAYEQTHNGEMLYSDRADIETEDFKNFVGKLYPLTSQYANAEVTEDTSNEIIDMINSSDSADEFAGKYIEYVKKIPNAEMTPEDEKSLKNVAQYSKYVQDEFKNRSLMVTYRNDNPTDSRSLLANALLTSAQNDTERKYITDYQKSIEKINSYQNRLAEVNAKIKELSFAEGKRDKEQLKSLKEEATKLANNITTYDKKLLRLEATKPIKNVLAREKTVAKKQAEERSKARLEEYKQKAVAKSEKLAETYAERQARAIERYKNRAEKREQDLTEMYEARLEREKQRRVNALNKEEERRENLKESHQKYVERVKEREQKLKDEARFKKEVKAQNRNAQELKTRIRKIADDLRGMLSNPTENRYVPYPLVNSVIDVCNAIDSTGRTYYKPGTHEIDVEKTRASYNEASKVAEKFANTRQALLELKVQYDELENAPDYDFSSEFNETFSRYIKELADAVGDTPVREMTDDQLSDVHDILFDIRNMIMSAKMQIGLEERITNYQVGQDIINNMEKVKELGLTTNRILTFFREWTENPMRATREMSGFDPNSRLVKLFEQLNEGRRKADEFRMMNNKIFDALRQTKEDEKSFNDAVQKANLPVTDIFGNTVMISHMQGLQAFLTWEREKANPNRKHLSTPVKFTDVELEAKGKYDEYAGHQVMVDENFINDLMKNLTEWDKRYLDAARTFFRVISRNAINEVSLVTKHRLIALEELYVPYYVNQDYIAKESENVKFDATIEGMGMLKSVKENAPQQLVMRGLNTIIADHIDKVAKVYGLAIPVRNWNKAFNVIQRKEDGGKAVREAVGETWGEGGKKLLEQAVADLQSNRKGGNSKLLSTVKSGFVTSTLASNISVWMKQAASYPTAGAFLSGKSLSSAAPYFTKNLKGIYDEIDKHTSQHYIRRIGLSTQELGEINQTNGWQNKLNRKLGNWSPMNWIQAMDVKTTAVLWIACKNEIESRGISRTDENYWNEVTKLYDKVIEETQPMYDPLHRAEITKNDIYKNIIMFQTQPIQNSGILREGAMELKMAIKKYGKNSAKTKEASDKFKMAVGSQVASHFTFTLMTLLSAAVLHKMNRYRDDDDELTTESVFAEFMKQFGENIFSAIVPVFGSYMTSIIEKFVDGNRYDVVSDATVDKVNDTINNFVKLKNPSWDSFINMASDIASYFGIPSGNLLNIINGARLHIEDAINGEFGSFESGVERTSTQEVNRSYEAYVSGDAEKFNSISVDQSSVTRVLKPKFLEAYSKNDTVTMANIRKYMKATKLYKNDIVEITQNWIKNSKK